jgi:hypothetical protein
MNRYNSAGAVLRMVGEDLHPGGSAPQNDGIGGALQKE